MFVGNDYLFRNDVGEFYIIVGMMVKVMVVEIFYLVYYCECFMVVNS